MPEEVQAEGACRLLRPRILRCEPPCSGGQTCGDGGACLPYPASVDVGKVTVVGMKAALSMEPSPPGNVYTNRETLPHPAFGPGDALQLAASGGEGGEPFVLGGVGVAPLDAGEDTVPVRDGEAVSLSWAPLAEPGPVSVHVELTINAHGTTPARIECEAPDTGSFEVPAGLVSALLGFGTSGWPSVQLTRRSADSTDLSFGCVQFVVVSKAGLALDVPGVVSCSDDTDCEGGQICQGDLTCG